MAVVCFVDDITRRQLSKL